MDSKDETFSVKPKQNISCLLAYTANTAPRDSGAQLSSVLLWTLAPAAGYFLALVLYDHLPSPSLTKNSSPYHFAHHADDSWCVLAASESSMMLWPCASLATCRVARAMDLKLGTARWPYGFVRDARPTSWLGNARRACGCGRDRMTTRPDSPWHHFSTRIGANITFDKVAREWRCKYAADASGGPADSASLKAAEELLQSYLPTLKALPNAEVTRVMCGGCHDFVRRLRPVRQ